MAHKKIERKKELDRRRKRRAERIKASGRWIPQSLDFTLAVANSRQHQTLNTPALATLLRGV